MEPPKEIYLQQNRSGILHSGFCDEPIWEDTHKDIKYIRSDLMLQLTVEDIERVHALLDAVRLNKTGAFTFTRLKPEQYAEVLKRFNSVKEKV